MVVLASSNQGKIKEFGLLLGDEVKAYSELIEPFEIIEDGDSFAQNALIKARSVYSRLGGEYLVLADDSGISVPALGGEPGIYSARYAKEGASDAENRQKLIDRLKANAIKRTPAFYTAALALVCKEGEYVVHGWMHGEVTRQEVGENGFGYDALFIPQGLEVRAAELSDEQKLEISHRKQALERMAPIVGMIEGLRRD